MSNCGQRAFIAGLRFAGISDDVPDLPTSNHIKALAIKYGLTVYDNDGGYVDSDNSPVLVVFKSDNQYGIDSRYHAVFCSDIAPVKAWPIIMIVKGWDRISKP